MTIRPAYLVLSLIFPALAVQAQHHHAPTTSPYVGLETRSVKTLSDQQIADLRAGRGMGLALPAELNGYPGPRHVLELQEALRLTDTQRARMSDLHDAMKAEVIPIGERLIAQEAELDRQFADRTVTLASLSAATRAIGLTRGELGAAHLKYHLSTVEVLSLEQVRLYGHLRGYGSR